MEDKKDNLKEVMALYPEKFVAGLLVEDAINSIVYASREDAIGKIRRIIEGKYQVTREIAIAKAKLAGLEASLVKTEGKIAEIEKGNFAVLFKNDGKDAE